MATEFTVKALPEITFRDARVSPIDLLAIATQVDFDQYRKTKELFQFSLEHIEANIGNEWLPVKVPGRDVYMPPEIETNYRALNQLCEWYMSNVILPAFPESAE